MTDPAALLTRLEQAKQSRDVWEIALAEQALENAAPDLAAHVTELEAENARLREGGSTSFLVKVLADIRHVTGLGEKPMLSDLAGEIGKLLAAKQAENARLRADFETALASAKDSHKMWTDCKEKLADAEAENKRLRKEMQIVIDDCEADYPPSHGAIKHGLRAALKGGE